ncbi:MAG: hypothetical protein R3250_13000 [Melioribacteraceae bacterium]|nr:hypothetical protein [Melioribacteraceae bacterium]
MKSVLKYLSPVIIIIGLYFIFKEKEITHPPGILAPSPPHQEKIKKNSEWVKQDFNFRGVAHFDITARVLSKRYYGSDDMSDFCPVDLALGWGRMSDQSVIDELDIKQQHRWYIWRTKRFPIPKKEIELSSSNIHIIPSSDDVEESLDDIVRGNIINIKGKLVNVNRVGEKFKWKSSTRRDDTGGGACEILWAENIKVLR